MLTLGIVGGVASGKSAAAQAFARHGAAVLDADRIGHEVLKDPEVVVELRNRWGNGILDAEGNIVRSAVAKIVFALDENGVTEREFLNSVSHPRIRRRMQERMNEERLRGTKIVVIDAALLFETGWNDLCDQVIFVDTPEAMRKQWAAQRGWTASNFEMREAAQLSVAEKRRRSDAVIDNDGDFSQLAAKVDHFVRALSGDANASEK